MPTIWNYYENFFISFSFYDLVVNLKNHNSYPVRGLSKEIIKLGRGRYTPAAALPGLLDSEAKANVDRGAATKQQTYDTHRPTKQVERNQRMLLRSIILLIT